MGRFNSESEKSKIEREKAPKVSRRNFLKGGAILGGVFGMVALPSSKALGAEVAETAIKKNHNELPVVISDQYKRFNQKNTTFCRMFWDPEIQQIAMNWNNEVSDKPGWTQLDIAINNASGSIYSLTSSQSAWGEPNTDAYAWEGPINTNQYKFKSTEDASKKIKRAARFLGASLVGIAKYDERWTYDPLYSVTENKEIPAKFPFEPKSVVVMAIEMDYKAYSTAPSNISEAATMLGYSKMAELANSVTKFLRELGYKAFGAGNDIAASVPYGIAAGLGECGRNSILVTYKYGPRVRICKVFTELELAVDKPVTFGVREFCTSCKRCAIACPSKAISMEDEPFWDPVCKSNNPGVQKWYLDAEKCLQFWAENGPSCSNCITSCPYNKPDFWHHHLTTAMAATPLKPILSKLDDAFGYGNVFDEKANREWWEKEEKN